MDVCPLGMDSWLEHRAVLWLFPFIWVSSIMSEGREYWMTGPICSHCGEMHLSSFSIIIMYICPYIVHRGMEVYTEIQGIIFDTRHSRVNFAESLSTCFRALIQWANFWIIPISIERSVTGLYSFRALCSDNSGHDNLFEQIAITACSKFSLVSCIRTLDEMFCFLHCNSIICKFLQFFLFHLILLMVAKDFQTGMSFHRWNRRRNII